TAFQGWDLVPGNREIDWHEQAIRRARHTLLVVFPATFEARGALAGWDGLLLADPDGSRRLLLPRIVHACDLGPSLGGLTPSCWRGSATCWPRPSAGSTPPTPDSSSCSPTSATARRS